MASHRHNQLIGVRRHRAERAIRVADFRSLSSQFESVQECVDQPVRSRLPAKLISARTPFFEVY